MRKAKVLDRRVYREGQLIFREGEQSWAAFLIERGAVDIVKNADGALPTVLATIGAGDLFGEMGLIDRAPRSATARAAEVTVVQVINEREFHRLLSSADPGLVALLRVLLRRLRATNDALVDQRGDECLGYVIPGQGARSAVGVNASINAARAS